MKFISGGKGLWRVFIILALVLITFLPASANYIGPSGRSYTDTKTVDYGVWARAPKYYCECRDSANRCSDCTICDWEGSPGSACGDATYSYKLGTRTIEETKNYPNATASGTFVCGTPGVNGWCKGGGRIDFTANEPVSGKYIQLIEGNLGLYCDPADAATVSCSWVPPQGANTITYWAHSTYGDTSALGTITGSVAFDSGVPTVSVGVGTPNGANGWFISPVTATATGGDSTSGLAALNVNIDGGGWQGNGTVYTSQGPHTVRGLATDNAGNTATSAPVTFYLDSVAPAITTGIPAPNGSNGWFKAVPVNLTVSGTDGTSGLSAAQIQVGAGAWVNNATSVSTDGTHTVNFRATDVAGNNSTTSATLKIDATAPTTTVSLAGTLGTNGWYTTKPVATAAGSDATSGVATSQVNLDGSAWAGSVTVSDGTHTVQAAVTDNAGNTSSVASAVVKVDTVAPTISPSATGTMGANGWYRSAVTLAVSGTDATSGMAAAEIQVDGGAWQVNSATVSTDGTHNVVYRTRDLAGNITTNTATVKVDRTLPTAAINPAGTAGLAGWFTSSVSADATMSDAASGIATREYRLNSGSWTSMTGAVSLTDGVHTFEIRATDNAGNVATATRTISVDTIEPTLSKVVPAADGAAGWYVNPFDVTVSGTDAGSGMAAAEIQIDGGAWAANTVNLSADGTHTVLFRTRDIAGNTTTQTVTVNLDQLGPSVSATPAGTSGLAGWYVTDVTMTIGAADPTSGIATREYRLNSGAWQPITGSTFSVSNGKHTIEVRATDVAGNTATTSRAVNVDTIDPVMTKVIPAVDGTAGWYINPVDLTVAGTDGGSGVAAAEVQVDSGAWTAGATTVSTDGPHTLNFRVRDVAGNEVTQTASIKVDLAGPVVTLIPTGTAGAGVWYISNVGIAATVTDSVSGATSTEYRVNAGAWTPLSAGFTLTDGVHSISIRSNDAAGNTTTVNRTILVDTVAPNVVKNLPTPDGKGGWYITNPNLGVSGTDATSGIKSSEIQVDSGAWNANSIVATGDGPHTIHYRVVDNAGNTSTASASINIDTTDPVATYTIPFGTPGDNGWYTSPTVTGSVSVTDATSGMAAVSYKIDGGIWTAGTAATISTDGAHTVDFSYTDNAGNTATLTRTIKVDSTDPTIIPISTGTEGSNDWWTTTVVVDPNPYDLTAGIAEIEISVNGGPWQPIDTVTLEKDGLYEVDVRVTDNAGNILTDQLDYKVDMTDPVCTITQPATDLMLTGTVNMAGSCTDGGSGVEIIVISVDGGETWQPVTIVDGNWTFIWDTVLYPGPVIVKGTDDAGNTETGTETTFKITNEGPRVELQEEWYVWTGGSLKIWIGDLPVSKVEISIADWKNRWPAREWTFDNVKNVPTEIKWDRKFADGTLAPIGDYAVRVTVYDTYNHKGYDQGKIVIPSGPQPTAVVQETQVATATAMPSPTATQPPTVTAMPSPTATAIAIAKVDKPVENKPVEVPVIPALPPAYYPALLLALLAMLGALLGLGLQAATDPRPKAISQLADTFDRLTQLHKDK